MFETNVCFIFFQVLQSRIELLNLDNSRLKGEMGQASSALQEAKDNSSAFQNRMEGLTQQLVETNEEYRRCSFNLKLCVFYLHFL